jgi:UbiD family decarboxylase
MVNDMRDWIALLEREGQLYRMQAEVDWRGELAEVQRQVTMRQGPAILYENITDYASGRCTKLFCGGIATQGRTALMLGMPLDSSREALIRELRQRLSNPITPEVVASGSVKENIVLGDDIDLFELPVPQWHPDDSGRYINTWGGVITRDPETGKQNVGVYRAVIATRNKINVLLVPAQNWGVHYGKYKEMGQPMPVALVFGWDPTMVFAGGMHLPFEEYDVMGGLRQKAVPLVKCETSDLMVPASAEIVVEGFVPPDPATYENEGPYGESTGYYSLARPRPVINVSCITHRNDPIFRGSILESGTIIRLGAAALVWNVLEQQDIPGILDVAVGSVTVIKIHKTYQGQARQVAAAIWGSRTSITMAKAILVVDDENEIDIADPAQVQMALTRHLEPSRGIVIYPLQIGPPVDPSLSADEQDEIEYGQALSSKLLIDGTVDWTSHPRREEWGGRRLSPNCFIPEPEVSEKVARRWTEYGIPESGSVSGDLNRNTVGHERPTGRGLI